MSGWTTSSTAVSTCREKSARLDQKRTDQGARTAPAAARTPVHGDLAPRFPNHHPDPRRITMANKAKNATQSRPKSIKEPDRPPMVSLKTKKTKKTSRGK
jgi:hypothetical protein